MSLVFGNRKAPLLVYSIDNNKLAMAINSAFLKMDNNVYKYKYIIPKYLI